MYSLCYYYLTIKIFDGCKVRIAKVSVKNNDSVTNDSSNLQKVELKLCKVVRKFGVSALLK